MTIEDLARIVLDMLRTQQVYFQTRVPQHLEESKEKEKKVRAVCRKILDGQKRMFEE